MVKSVERICAALVFVFVVGLGFCYAQSATTSPPEVAPVVKQFIGPDDSYLDPSLYPSFQNIQGDNLDCIRFLQAISLQPRGGGTGQWEELITADPITIDPQYAKKGRILITWTVRIIGYPVTLPVFGTDEINLLPPALRSKMSQPKLRNVINRLNRGLCTWWHGSTNQYYAGGMTYGRVYTRLVDATSGRALSRDIVMTLPDGGTTTNVVVYDPTHSGSVLLTPEMYGGTFPSTFTFSVQWKNSSPMLVFSEAGMRNIIITVTRE